MPKCNQDCLHCVYPDCVHDRPIAQHPVGKRIGDKIKTARLKAGLSQKQLADLLGTYSGTVCRWELNDSGPSYEYYEKLVRLFPELKR